MFRFGRRFVPTLARFSGRQRQFLGLAAISSAYVSYTIATQQPICLDSATSPQVCLPGPIAADAQPSKKQHEETHKCKSTTGISSYHVSQFDSNHPSEDEYAHGTVSTPTSTWSFLAVFDGHAGWETSAFLHKTLIPAVIGSLADLYSSHHQLNGSPDPPPESIDKTIKETFVRIDDEIVHEPAEKALAGTSRKDAVQLLATAYAGSCALLSFFDSESQTLRVAVTGDSRAILGRQRDDGQFEVHVLSADQNGYNLAEQERMNALHPEEHDMFSRGRTLGWGISRAFGDAMYKWSKETQESLREKHLLGRSTPAKVKTPPYFTAEPEVTTTAVKPGDFLVIASDGLWESLTNEEVVGLVGLWLEKKNVASIEPGELKIDLGHEDNDKTVRYRQWRAEKRFMVDRTSNAATHLIHNATGGADRDLREGIEGLGSRSRTYIDDITVIVAFFGEE